jgi:glycosyltransferase involved in cell wall biosynthesis
MNDNPKVSIVIPTYNRMDLLLRAIKSVFNQTFSDYEIIIINDASTDGTKKYLDELAKNDLRIKIIHHEKNYYPDISRTLNEGLNLARGKYIARLDDDDYWSDKEKLAKQVAFLDAHEDYVIVGGGMIVINLNGTELFRYLKSEKDESIRKSALFANPFSHTTVMFCRDIALGVGGYKNWDYAEDWNLWLSLGKKGKMYNFPEYFGYYTMSGTNKSLVCQRAQSRTILKIIYAHKKEYPNFFMAYIINLMQYIYSFLPFGIRSVSHNFLSKIKRKIS